MKTAFRKNIFRTIKKSLGRYMAIFAIIALGVGFFCGLQSSRPAMMKTGQEYVRGQDLFDYRLISTWGFDEEEIRKLRELDGVKTAEGALWEDFIYINDEGTENCLKALSITEDVNRLTVVAGRLPEKADECVVDAVRFPESFIGQKIAVSSENSQETRDSFAYESYTVTGLVRSPLYLNMERGTTTIGSGKITAFVFLLPEGFSYEYYEEVYVTADMTEAAFTDAYEEEIEVCTDIMEEDSTAIVETRYRKEVANAEDEIADAEAELTEKEADARAELADARAELEDGEQKLKDGRQELVDARETLKEKEQELRDGEQELKDGEAALSEGEASLAQGEAALTEAESTFVQGEEALQAGEAQYQQGLAEYETGREKYENGLKELEEKRPLYQQAKVQKQQLEAAGLGDALLTDPGYLMLCKSIEEFEAGERELNGTKIRLDQAKIQLDASLGELTASRSQLETSRSQLADSRRELNENRELLTEKRQLLEQSRVQIEDGKRQIADGREELKEAEQKIADSEQELKDGWKEYEDGLKELDQEVEDARKEIADAREELADLEEPEVFVLDRGTNVGYASYESDVSIVDGIAKIFPAFFFLIAALVCSTTMTRMVDDERTQIGTLRALGYTKSAILMKYMIYSGSAAALGACIGYYVGSRMFPTAIWTAYAMLYGFADIIIVDHFLLFLFSLLVSLFCSVGTTFLACRMELVHAPAELIRPKAPAAGKRILLEKITILWKHLKFLHKVSARNVFRFKKRMFMMIVGIAGCMALVMAGFGVNDSISNIVNDQYDHILKYDISAAYTKAIPQEALDEIEKQFDDDITNQAVLLETSVEAPYAEGVKTVTLMVSEDASISQCVDFHRDGEAVPIPGKGEILIDKRLAEVYDAGIGDEITLKIGERNTAPLRVAGIFDNYTFYYAYVTGETYEEYFGEVFEPKTIYLALAEGVDHYQVASYLADMKNAANISVVADMRARVENTMESMNYIVALVILSAAALAFIVLFNLGNINISERVREIATLKVLGFYPRETGTYVFRESMVLSVMGIVAGIPLGILLHRFVILQIKIDMVSPDIKILPLSYLYSVLLVLGFTVCVDLILRRKINRINMAESLKSIE